MERNLDITFFSRKFSKIAVFDYDYIIIIYNINNKSARFQSIGTTSDFGTKFLLNYINDKTFDKLNMEIVIGGQ